MDKRSRESSPFEIREVKRSKNRSPYVSKSPDRGKPKPFEDEAFFYNTEDPKSERKEEKEDQDLKMRSRVSMAYKDLSPRNREKGDIYNPRQSRDFKEPSPNKFDRERGNSNLSSKKISRNPSRSRFEEKYEASKPYNRHRRDRESNRNSRNPRLNVPTSTPIGNVNQRIIETSDKKKEKILIFRKK